MAHIDAASLHFMSGTVLNLVRLLIRSSASLWLSVVSDLNIANLICSSLSCRWIIFSLTSFSSSETLRIFLGLSFRILYYSAWSIFFTLTVVINEDWLYFGLDGSSVWLLKLIFFCLSATSPVIFFQVIRLWLIAACINLNTLFWLSFWPHFWRIHFKWFFDWYSSLSVESHLINKFLYDVTVVWIHRLIRF